MQKKSRIRPIYFVFFCSAALLCEKEKKISTLEFEKVDGMKNPSDRGGWKIGLAGLDFKAGPPS